MDLNELKKPFPRELISWRVGSLNKDKTKAIALAYIDARDVMERLDAVCTPAAWQAKHPHANGKTSCAIGIKINDEWVWKENGAGDSQVEAEKGAFSDSMKRAAVMWGIGRYLYDVANVWVDVEPYGKSFKIKNPKDPALVRALEQAEKGIRLTEDAQPENKAEVAPVEIQEYNLIIGAIQSAKTPEEVLEVRKAKIAPAWPRLSTEMREKIQPIYNNRLAAVSQAPVGA